MGIGKDDLPSPNPPRTGALGIDPPKREPCAKGPKERSRRLLGIVEETAEDLDGVGAGDRGLALSAGPAPWARAT